MSSSSFCRPSLQSWSLAFAIPLAFIVAAIVGVAIERLVIRYLYTRPLETLLATWGVSLILQQLVRSLFGANNRQVTNPPFMSGAFHLGGLEITTNRLWIIVLAIVVFVGLQLVLRATPFGLQMRAVTQNRRMAAAMGISTAGSTCSLSRSAPGSRDRGRRAVADRQRLAEPRPGLHHRQLHGRGVRRRRQPVGHRARRADDRLANKILEPLIGAVQGQIVLLIVIILFIQKRPRGLFALKGRAVEA